MSIPPSIPQLIQRFRENLSDYRSGKYNETQVRREFLDPFFEALGWDVNNTQGYAEAYKDVVHEDAVKVGGMTKAPDYGFRVGGTRKFFVEAKKPSVNVREEIPPAFQLRRYAWSAKLPLSILTDFEEFAVYDCRVKPDKTDKASTARVMYCTFEQYMERWEEIAAVFSREAVLKGSFDRYAEAATGKRGTQEVDEVFLAEIERWRELLARNIALRNPGLSVRDLNYAVQLTIDRLVFLRIGEDRGFEPYERLRQIAAGKEVYARLLEVFREADARYNSGLFHLRAEKGRENADTLTPRLVIDDKVFKEILSNLYYPDSPYDFNVMPADILGQVYEQFLGKVIRLTKGGGAQGRARAEVEDKPEVKKAGGVYYTPTYIVEYIVRHTVGKLVEGKSPEEVAGLKICDPACGSGSFLLGAYQFLLDWHLAWYVAHQPEKWARGKSPTLTPGLSTTQPSAFQGEGGERSERGERGSWKLTTSEKRRILLNNLYGVDIDPQAVEVTKLSLLLKVLEGENEGSLRQLAMFHERVLPDLNQNIKCGNSLIGPDFYDGGYAGQMAMFDMEESYRINAFDWGAEFPQVFSPRPGGRGAGGEGASGGFDAVIGNPPYVRQELISEHKEYFEKHYAVYNGAADLYTYFIEKGVTLLRPGGHFSYIVANKWMRARYGEPLRRWIKNQHIEEIVDFGDLPVFHQATTYPCIIHISKEEPADYFQVTQVETLDFLDLSDYVAENNYRIDVGTLANDGWSLVEGSAQALVNKLNAMGVPLTKYVKGNIFRGVVTGANEVFVIDQDTKDRLIKEDQRSEEIIKPFITGREVKRYKPTKPTNYLIFTRRGINIREYPAIQKYLNQFKERLMPKPKDWNGDWKGRKPGSYQWFEIQDSTDYFQKFDEPKIIIPSIIQRASYTFDETGIYSNDKTSIIVANDLYLLGILNSKVPDFIMHLIASTKQGGYFEYKPMYLAQLPIRPINFSDPADVARHDRMVALVQSMLDLHQRLAAAHTPTEKTMIERQIKATDGQIDRLVYELYGLTEEEVGIVEG